MDGKATFEQACDELSAKLPDKLRRGLNWMRSPAARWVRIPIGLLCIAGACLWFLPVAGIELLPIGLLLLAQDVPFLRKPVGLFILFLVQQWRRLRVWYAARHSRAR